MTSGNFGNTETVFALGKLLILYVRIISDWFGNCKQFMQ